VFIGDLVDIVSKNGAMLLNIGPCPVGIIPQEEGRLRFTCRVPERIHDDILYAAVLAWPEDGQVLIRSLAAGSGLLLKDICQIVLLGGQKNLPFTRADDGLRLQLADQKPADYALVLELYLNPALHQRRLQDRTFEHGPSYDS
jgi:alpha-L-fucosidase